MVTNNKILVILGPTASGKSDFAIKLAGEFDGEIISADSRQIYRGMDIGTGKVHGTWSMKHGAFVSEKIPHYMIDIVNPNTKYNVAKFKKQAEKIIQDILKRGKLPILCGGTGFWIKAIVDNVVFPKVKPDWNLRKKLNKESVEKLFKQLQKLDPERAKTIEAQNKVRLIRAIEICRAIGKVPSHRTWNIEHKTYTFLQFGVTWPRSVLQKRIKTRLEKRLKQGMIAEVRKLHQQGISWKRLESFGLEYRWIATYLQRKISREEMEEKLYFDIIHYAKRQTTWFKRDSLIKWTKNYSVIKKEAKIFLK